MLTLVLYFRTETAGGMPECSDIIDDWLDRDEPIRSKAGLSRAIISLSRAIISLSRAIISLSRAIISVSRAIISVSRAIISLSRAIISLSRAAVTLSRAIISLSCAIISLSRAAVTLSRVLSNPAYFATVGASAVFDPTRRKSHEQSSARSTLIVFDVPVRSLAC